MAYDFEGYKKDATRRPSAKAWANWAKFEKAGDMVQGFIRDVFYRKAEGIYKDARGITLEQKDGTLVNVSIKRLDFVLADTDKARLGDPLTVVLEELKPNAKPGFNATKIFGYYTVNVPETVGQKTVAELDAIDRQNGGQSGADGDQSKKADQDMADMAKSASAALDSTPKA